HTQTGRARPDPPNLVARNPDQTHRSTLLQCNCLAASMNPPILLKMTVHLNRSGLAHLSYSAISDFNSFKAALVCSVRFGLLPFTPHDTTMAADPPIKVIHSMKIGNTMLPLRFEL